MNCKEFASQSDLCAQRLTNGISHLKGAPSLLNMMHVLVQP